MAKILARVELHGASDASYNELHSLMSNIGFSKTITTDDGRRWELPSGTYVTQSNMPLIDIRENVSLIANSLSTSVASVWVCNYDDSAWILYPATN